MMRPNVGKALTALLLFVTIAARAEPPPARVSALEIARQFAEYRWTASEQNARHGADPDGVNVQTPDTQTGGQDCWTPGVENVGVPYKWGGYDTLASFAKGVKAGKAAGDVYTAEKRRKGGDAVSHYAVGIDCSGFISRCWQLDRKYSTDSLCSISKVLSSTRDLEPADIMNAAGGHVILFAKWLDETRTRALFYESSPYSKVLASERDVAELEAAGFRPMRYTRFRE